MLALAPDSLGEHLARWAAGRLSCEVGDREEAAAGIRLAYRSVGLEPPQRIVWCRGPLEIAGAIAASSGRVIGANVKTAIHDAVRDRIAMCAEIQWKEHFDAASRLMRPIFAQPPFDQLTAAERVSAAIARAACRAATRLLHRRSVRLRHALHRGRSVLPRADFAEISIGPSELLSLGVFEYLRLVTHWTEHKAPLRGLCLVARNAGWIVPYERICWIAQRVSCLQYDGQGRLHATDGPALRCRDGWAVWAWKGVQVPSWMIERPELVTIGAIETERDPVLRRCMIDIMTPEDFVRTGRAARVAEDETGVLWRATWSYRGARLGVWTAVEVQDGSADGQGRRKRYVLPVPSHVNSPREAVAWTYGMTEAQYAQLDLRT